jgi:hypothetical protein
MHFWVAQRAMSDSYENRSGKSEVGYWKNYTYSYPAPLPLPVPVNGHGFSFLSGGAKRHERLSRK